MAVLTACGSSTIDSTNIIDAQSAEMTTVEELAVEDATNTAEQDDSVVENSDAELLSVGNTAIVDDVCEITLDYSEITNDVEPKNPTSYYSHYVADSGKTYVDVCVAYKNIATNDIVASDTTNDEKLIYAGKYEYSGFSCIEEDDRGDFTYSNITTISPLTTEYMHYIFEVPEEVGTSDKQIEVYLSFAGKEYKVEVNQGSVDSSTSSESAENVDAGGIVTDGEVVTTANSEFSVDYSNITDDVMPKNPDSYYTHYVADDGKVFVDFCIAYKNTSGSDIIADEIMNATLTYADKYEYTGASMIEEDNRGDFTYSNITSVSPLNTEYVHYLFEVPEEVENSSESVAISFTIDGSDFEYVVR
jgi:hypothetical protein